MHESDRYDGDEGSQVFHISSILFIQGRHRIRRREWRFVCIDDNDIRLGFRRRRRVSFSSNSNTPTQTRDKTHGRWVSILAMILLVQVQSATVYFASPFPSNMGQNRCVLAYTSSDACTMVATRDFMFTSDRLVLMEGPNSDFLYRVCFNESVSRSPVSVFCRETPNSLKTIRFGDFNAVGKLHFFQYSQDAYCDYAEMDVRYEGFVKYWILLGDGTGIEPGIDIAHIRVNYNSENNAKNATTKQ